MLSATLSRPGISANPGLCTIQIFPLIYVACYACIPQSKRGYALNVCACIHMYVYVFLKDKMLPPEAPCFLVPFL